MTAWGEPTDEAPRRLCFVGREDILSHVDGCLTGRRHYGLQPSGAWGIGKSSLLQEIEGRARAKHVVVLGPVKASAYADALSMRFGGRAPAPSATGEWVERVQGPMSVRELLNNFDQYVHVLEDLIRDAASRYHGFATLNEQIAHARNSVALYQPSTASPLISAAGTIQAAVNRPPDQGAAELFMELEINRHVPELGLAFTDTVNRAAEASGAVLLIDEFERLHGHPLRGWLLKVVNALDRAVVIVASREEESGDALTPRQLPRFTREDVAEYLVNRFRSPAPDSLVERVYAFSHGLPQAVAIAGDLIDQRRRSGGYTDLRDVGFDNTTLATTTLLSVISTELPTDDSRLLLREGRLARHLDEDIAHHLLFGISHREGSPEQRTRALAAWDLLKNRYSFLEEVVTPTVDRRGSWRFHEYLTRADDAHLRVNEELVHEKLAAWYESRLEEYDEQHGDKGVYMQWYKYEQREWQTLTLEWLHHAGRLTDRDQRMATRTEFARVFLDAFWWWGCYVRYDFCKDLLDDWERTQPSHDREVSRLLREILEAYPLGHRKQDAGDWKRVASALEQLRLAIGVGGTVSRHLASTAGRREKKRAESRWYVRAFTSLFLAHSYRFRTGVADVAREGYEDALKYLRATGDRAAEAWTRFELADLELELGQTDEARDRLREAARMALGHDDSDDEGEEDEEDRAEDLELLANLHRLHGDLLAANAAAWQAVLDATARSVLRAFAYLNEPNPPDLYTVTFYEEIRERAAERLLSAERQLTTDLRQDRPAAYLAGRLMRLRPVDVAEVEHILAAVNSADEARTIDGIKAALTPPPPVLGPAARSDEEFVVRSKRVLAQVRSDRAADVALMNLP